MERRPRSYDDAAECVQATLERVGPQIGLALPLGIGKPHPIVNEFYRRARRDPAIRLRMFTALSLELPRARGELERRFLEPLVRRTFGNFEPLDYVADLHSGTVPDNVEIVEFYLEPGAFLGSTHAQRHYVSSNYTHVARDVAARGVNVIAQVIAKRQTPGGPEYSLGSNPDLTLELLDRLAPQRRAGKLVVIGAPNRQMPFMFGPAMVGADTFDFIVEHPRYECDLFAPPSPPLSTVDYAIGLHAARLVRDGGTLQIGIGEIGDAVVYGLQLRHQRNNEFLEIHRLMRAAERGGAGPAAIGGDAPFESGLYACTEMLVDGFLELYRSGILRRRVYADARVQGLLAAGEVGETVDGDFLGALGPAGFASPLSPADFAILQRLGVWRDECRYADGRITGPDGVAIDARLDEPRCVERLAAHCAGKRLRNGALSHAAFFLGSRGFYAALRDMPEAERRQFPMCGVEFTNQIDGQDRALRVAQRTHGRFVNSAMLATLLGAAVSDGLADGRVVSGVGGQYNFVAMAHALPDARSIIAVRSTREKDGRVTSNLVWNYGHTTIPRHLRDIVVTEYGVADLRGLSDEDVIAAMLNVADSRFQESLLREAQAAGKISRSYRIPEVHRNNTPRALEEQFLLPRARGLFSEFPFGTDLTREEIVLAQALAALARR
ncbi:MAG TPA: acetyl-CoA hydrolase/transferase C-terminal domain-containing protein, partial [Steroidobacteraceae bacterium]|nr:acetyl-CoA hydrolase/transferase C-terminal domain-containing protein [Steroidobacteraceae bacterium]